MPFHRIYAPPGFFSAQEKQALALSVTAVYERLPGFYVIINFIDVAEESFFIGNQNWSARKQTTGKPFVRILVQHLAVHQTSAQKRAVTLEMVENGYRPVLEARALDWELTIEEPPSDYWKMSGHVPPLVGPSDAVDMQRWREADRPVERTSK